VIDKKKAIDELKRLNGHPPYNEWSNYCYGDAYYAMDIEKRYGMTIEKLTEFVNYYEKPRRRKGGKNG